MRNQDKVVYSQVFLLSHRHNTLQTKLGYLAHTPTGTGASGGFFSGDYISALRGCCALKFLHVVEIHQGYLAHTPTGTGVPQKILIVKIKNRA